MKMTNAISDKIIRAFGLIFSFVFLYLASIPLHEFFHWLAAYLQGTTTYISFDFIKSFYLCGWTAEPSVSLSPLGIRFFYLAGGLFTGLIYYLGWLYSRWTKSKWDLNWEFSFFTIGSIHFFYSLTEMATFANGPINGLIRLLALIGCLIAYAPELIGYIGEEPNAN